jgi:hypothetical protein
MSAQKSTVNQIGVFSGVWYGKKQRRGMTQLLYRQAIATKLSQPM